MKQLSAVLTALLLGAGFACAPAEPTGQPAAEAPREGWDASGHPEPSTGGDDISGPYDVVEGWPDNPCGEGWQQGAVSGVFAETPDRVFVFQRGCLPEVVQPGHDPGLPIPGATLKGQATNWWRGCCLPARNASTYDLTQVEKDHHPRWDHILLIYNRDGQLVDSWERHNRLFVRPHRVRINPHDPERHVWIIDDGAHSIYKFTADGELVMTLGQFKEPGDDEVHFNRPTDVAFLPEGDFFVSDGYTNTRVIRFDSEGKFQFQWGQLGDSGRETRPGYFNTVHAVVVDDRRQVYVADRGNRRIQVFDEQGAFLREWYTYFPYSMYMSGDQHLWVGDGHTNKILKYDLNGKLLFSWGTFGTFPGGMWGPHQFTVDAENNLYIADVHVGRVQKFRPRAGANPALLVGQRGKTAW